MGPPEIDGRGLRGGRVIARCTRRRAGDRDVSPAREKGAGCAAGGEGFVWSERPGVIEVGVQNTTASDVMASIYWCSRAH